MKAYIIIVVLLLVGCKIGVDEKIRPENYICNDSQLELVKKEVEICGTTSYSSSYCFAQAKATICSPLVGKEN